MSTTRTYRKLPGRNVMARRIAPGLWVDADGKGHVSADELMDLFHIDKTPDNRKDVMDFLEDLMKQRGHNVARRMKPED